VVRGGVAEGAADDRVGESPIARPSRRARPIANAIPTAFGTCEAIVDVCAAPVAGCHLAARR
jgi:hypothetical protein